MSKDSLTKPELSDVLRLAILYVLAILVSGLQFGRVYEDSESYLALVDWFRGSGELIPPFCYRPAIPFLTSVLPFDPVLSFSLISLVFLIALTTMVYLICLQIGVSRLSAFIGTAIATGSWPVYNYGAVVLVDSSYIFFVALAVLLMLRPDTRNRRYLILSVIMLCVFFKESAAIAAVAYILYRREWRQAPIFVMGPGLAYLGCRLVVGVLHMEGAQDFWVPRLFFITERLPITLRMLALGFVSFAWILVFIPFTSIHDERKSWFLAVGLSMALLMLYAMTAASFDTRFIWPLYLMLAPLAGVVFDRLFARIKNREESRPSAGEQPCLDSNC